MNSDAPIPLGYIVGEAQPQEFQFVTSRQLAPPRLEYLVVRGVAERRGDDIVRVDVLAQVASLGVDSAVLTGNLTFEEVGSILAGRLVPPPKIMGTCRVIGYLEDGSVRRPRSAAMPGQPVYLASDELLQEFFTRRGASLTVGSLMSRPGVPVALDPNGFRRHLAVIAQTGAGKSYLVGKPLESLVALGATVIVLDPNSDYVQLRKTAADANRPYDAAERTPFAENVAIYRIPGVRGRRFPDELVGPTREFTVHFSALDPEELSDLAGIPAKAVRLREAVRAACNQLAADGIDYRPAELMEALRALAATGGDGGEGAGKAVRYVEFLVRYSVWGFRDVPVEDLLRPQQITVVDLAGTDKTVVSYVADRILREIWARATTGELAHPVFVVLEEAHNLVPNDQYGTRASRVINTVAAEGRKFRVFLMVITQRPSKIHQDTLSQCGSQIVMQLTNPDDQRAVQQASEAISADLLADLPALNTGEAIILGQLTRVPVMVRVGGRLSAEGGSDIDLVDALARAAESARIERMAARAAPAPVERQKEDWL